MASIASSYPPLSRFFRIGGRFRPSRVPVVHDGSRKQDPRLDYSAFRQILAHLINNSSRIASDLLTWPGIVGLCRRIISGSWPLSGINSNYRLKSYNIHQQKKKKSNKIKSKAIKTAVDHFLALVQVRLNQLWSMFHLKPQLLRSNISNQTVINWFQFIDICGRNLNLPPAHFPVHSLARFKLPF